MKNIKKDDKVVLEEDSMKEEPEIVKTLKGKEKQEKLQCQIQSNYREYQTEDKSSDDVPDETIDFIKNDTEIEELETIQTYDDSLIGEFKDLHELLFRNTTDFMLYLDKYGKIIRMNKAGLEFSGFTEKEVIGKLFWELPGVLSKKDVPDYSRVFKNVLSGEKTEKFVGKFKDKTGKTHIMEFSTHVIEKNNKMKYIFVIGRDITDTEALKSMNEELKATQEELRTLKGEFEQKVSERTAEIEKLLKHKNEFIAQLGHDLKSPLTPLVGLLPIVKEQVEDPKLERLLEVSIRNVKYMRDLVVKTLELERLNSSKTVFNIGDINLLETVNNIIENKQLIFKEKKINIENNINKKIMVRANNLQLGELFDNLITNAVKFTPQDGTITIDAKKVKDFVTVSIKDTGIGMTEGQINRIFAEFYKVDPARHDLDSGGLGLSICKRIVEKHGGRIWAESPGLGKGTTFYFTIPFRRKKIKASQE